MDESDDSSADNRHPSLLGAVPRPPVIAPPPLPLSLPRFADLLKFGATGKSAPGTPIVTLPDVFLGHDDDEEDDEDDEEDEDRMDEEESIYDGNAGYGQGSAEERMFGLWGAGGNSTTLPQMLSPDAPLEINPVDEVDLDFPVPFSQDVDFDQLLADDVDVVAPPPKVKTKCTRVIESDSEDEIELEDEHNEFDSVFAWDDLRDRAAVRTDFLHPEADVNDLDNDADSVAESVHSPAAAPEPSQEKLTPELCAQLEALSRAVMLREREVEDHGIRMRVATLEDISRRRAGELDDVRTSTAALAEDIKKAMEKTGLDAEQVKMELEKAKQEVESLKAGASGRMVCPHGWYSDTPYSAGNLRGACDVARECSPARAGHAASRIAQAQVCRDRS